jgi:hypothetical protein
MRIAGDQGLVWLWELGGASAEDRSVRLMVRSGSGLGWTVDQDSTESEITLVPMEMDNSPGNSIERGEAWMQSWSIGM